VMNQVRVSRLASAIDTAPTILDLIGESVPETHQGTSLLIPGSHPVFFFTDYSLGWLGMREGCWKFLYETGSKRSKLFDLCRDPEETRDVSEAHEGLVLSYRERVQRWAGAQSDAVRNGRDGGITP
jgi:arylsulfatase A-like enzyme